MKRSTVAVTMGDPAGIGPEIVVRALAEAHVREECNPVVIGDPDVIARVARAIGSALNVEVIPEAARAGSKQGTIEVIAGGQCAPGAIAPGKLAAVAGEAAADCCRKAVKLARAQQVGAIVSAPLNKEAFHLAGYTAMDDMEYFEECFNQPGAAYMIGEVADLWVTPVTLHVPFREIADLLTIDSVLTKIRQLHRVLAATQLLPSKIGVAGLNVHAGEGGVFGREEIDVIGPAIEQARADGIEVYGPIPADSLFPMALGGRFRGLVCMYHDQANIGRKILGRDHPGVSLYLGMVSPVVTVPHGTAYDIAGKGVAKHAMLSRAIVTAAALAGAA